MVERIRTPTVSTCQTCGKNRPTDTFRLVCETCRDHAHDEAIKRQNRYRGIGARLSELLELTVNMAVVAAAMTAAAVIVLHLAGVV